MIDTHAHLNDERLTPDFDLIVGGFEQVGLEAVVNVGADYPGSVRSAASG